MSRLTVEETKWLKCVQMALNKKVSGRIGFFVTGDNVISVYDKTFDDEINDIQDSGTTDMCAAVEKCKADFNCMLIMPSPVHSTAG